MEKVVRYARNGEVAIGYTVVGEGPADLVYLAAFSNLDLAWDNPLYARFLSELASFSRLILVDRRGTGVSDRYAPGEVPPFEELVDDLDAVLDAAGSERTALFGYSDTGALCAMFAATRPDRVSGLILHATAARGRQAPDYPWQWSDEEWKQYLDELRDPSAGYGTREYAEATLPLFAPSLGADERMVEWWERFQRHSASPSALYAQEQVFQKMDIRAMLPSIGVPTWSFIGPMTPSSPSARGAISGKRSPTPSMSSSGGDHIPWRAGRRHARPGAALLRPGADGRGGDIRPRLATALFTDIVDSTAQAERWAIRPGVRCANTSSLTRAQLPADEDVRSRRRATGSSQSSTVRPGQPAAPPDLRVDGTTRRRASRWAAYGGDPARGDEYPASRRRSVPGSAPLPGPGRVWSRPP